MACGRLAYTKTFQSTLSMRRATRLGRTTLRIPAFQSTLSMRRATGWLAVDLAAHSISIHALHEESDPTRPHDAPHPGISIHALHEESDWMAGSGPRRAFYFNPRSP